MVQLRKIYVAGHRGMVGSAVLRRLADEPVELILRTRDQLDLTDQHAVNAFFAEQSIDGVIFCSARVGGILANRDYPAEFGYENLMMACNAIHAAYQSQVDRFLFLGSTCIYPRDCPQPIQEQSLLTGPLEPTNEPYALAKIAGLKLCQYYRRQYGVRYHSAMPTNLYGPGDNYHPEHSHVLPALIRRFHEAKFTNAESVTIWGSGKPRREFLHVDDLADALWHLMQKDHPQDWVNVGTGEDISIAELARLVAEIVGFEGGLEFDSSRPDGTPVKRTDMTQLHSQGWQARTTLREGIAATYAAFQTEQAKDMLRSF